MTQKKCIGKCTNPTDKYVNPITLDIQTNNTDQSICITNPHKKNNDIFFFKNCDIEENPSTDYITDLIIKPISLFNSDYLLSFYDISTIDELMEWIYTQLKMDTPLETIVRVLNSFLKTYGKNIKKIDNKIYSIFHEIFVYRIDKKIDNKINKKKFYELIVKTFKNIFDKKLDLIKFNLFNDFKKNLELYYRND